MKYIIIIMLFLSILAGCKKNREILFCQGFTPKTREGVECGKKFAGNELTAVITSDDPFGVKKITIEIYEIKDKKEIQYEKLALDVKPEESKIITNLSFHNDGTYTVKALKKKKVFAVGSLEVIEAE